MLGLDQAAVFPFVPTKSGLRRLGGERGGHGRTAEDERDQGVAPGRVDGDEPSRSVVQQHVVGSVGRAAQRHGRDVDAEVVHEFGFAAEREPPDGRVQAVGTDDQIEPARLPAFEADIDAGHPENDQIAGFSDRL